jgi:hypothetical protein
MYVVSLILMWYENKVKVIAASMKPRIVRSPAKFARSM